MIIKVLDMQNNVIEQHDGVMDNGGFHYKDGGFPIPFTKIRFFAKDKILDIKWENSIIEGKTKINYVKFDGKDYIPLILHHAKYEQPNHSIQDYLNLNRQAEQAENETLAKPLGLQQILSIIMVIACVLTVGFLYYTSNNLYSEWVNAVKPFNQSINQQGTLISYIIKSQNKTLTLYNETLALAKGSGANP